MTINDLRQEGGTPVLIADHDGFITYVNERFEQVFGYAAAQVLGKPLTIIIPRQLHGAHHLGFSRFLTTGKPTLLGQPLRLKAVGKDGREFDAEHMIIAEQIQGQWVFGATIRPLK